VAGVSPAVGTRWFREGGGMRSVSHEPLSGRYLSFAERVELRSCAPKGAVCGRSRGASAVRRRRFHGSCTVAPRPEHRVTGIAQELTPDSTSVVSDDSRPRAQDRAPTQRRQPTHQRHSHRPRMTTRRGVADPALVAVVWDVLSRAASSGGRVLEPGCGSGTFIGHAPQRGDGSYGERRQHRGIAAASTRRPQPETRALRPLVLLFKLGGRSERLSPSPILGRPASAMTTSAAGAKCSLATHRLRRATRAAKSLPGTRHHRRCGVGAESRRAGVDPYRRRRTHRRPRE